MRPLLEVATNALELLVIHKITEICYKKKILGFLGEKENAPVSLTLIKYATGPPSDLFLRL